MSSDDGTTDNTATVSEIYGAFGRGDVPAILERMADDVEWEPGRTDDFGVPWLRPGRGKDFVASFFEIIGTTLEITRFEPRAIAGAGDTVLAANDLEMVVLATGKTVVDVEVHIWTFNPDGSVRSMRHVVDTLLHARALEP